MPDQRQEPARQEAQGQRIRIGKIAAPQGVRGHVRLYPLSDFPERWPLLRAAYMGDEPAPRAVRFQGWTRGNTMPILQIEGVEDRSAAEALRGLYLSIPREEIHPLPADTYYTFQLEGLAAEDPDGHPLGRVMRVEESPGNDLLVLALPSGREARVPMVRAFVQNVDLAGGRVVIRPIPGLLEE